MGARPPAAQQWPHTLAPFPTTHPCPPCPPCSQAGEALGLRPVPPGAAVAALHGAAPPAGALLFTDAASAPTALLCEGPAHHSRSMPFAPLGQTLLGRHALARAGWCVVPLPWYEWVTLCSVEDQVVHVAGKLVEAGVRLAPR